MAISINTELMVAKPKMSVTEFAGKTGITAEDISVSKNRMAQTIRLSTLDHFAEPWTVSPEIFWNL